MITFILVVVALIVGYFVGSKNPAQSVKDKITAEIKARL